MFKHEYMDMSVPALVGQGEVGEVKLRERVDSGNERQIGLRVGTKKFRAEISYGINHKSLMSSTFPGFGPPFSLDDSDLFIESIYITVCMLLSHPSPKCEHNL